MVRAVLSVLALCVAAAAAGQSDAPSPAAQSAAPPPAAQPASEPVTKPAAQAAGKSAAKPAKSAKRKSLPVWAELSADQQMILAPLKPDWETLEVESKRKWIGIAKRYPRMKAQGQERVQRRMQAWAGLTPDQRRQARENYRQIAKVPPDKRNKLREQWAEYQQLSPLERQRLVPEQAEPAPKKKKK